LRKQTGAYGKKQPHGRHAGGIVERLLQKPADLRPRSWRQDRRHGRP
jgi:hypothetical protein